MSELAPSSPGSTPDEPSPDIAAAPAQTKRRANPWLIALAILIVVSVPFACAMLQVYHATSQDMANTILPDDVFFVEKFGTPQRGDVVLFAPPANATAGTGAHDPVLRVIGLPGDTVQVKAGQVTVSPNTLSPKFGVGNADPHNELRLRLNLTRTDSVKFFADHIAINDTTSYTTADLAKQLGDPSVTVTIVPGQVLVNGKPIDEPYTREDPAYNYPANGQPFTVPAGQLFLLGDNRNESSDSHVWGPIPASSVIGRAWYRYYPGFRSGTIE